MNTGVIVSIRERLFRGKHWHSTPRGRNIIQSWCRGLAMRLQLHIDTNGLPVEQPHVQVANHISWLDVIVLGANHPLSFVAKAEIADWPIIGFLASMGGTCFLKRGSVSSLRALIPTFQSRCENGTCVAVFPEGTTSDGNQVATFHGSLFQIMIDAELPIQPVTIHYHGNEQQRRTAAYINDDRFLAHLWSLTACHNIKTEVHYLPVKQSRDKQRRLLAKHCEEVIATQLNILRQQPLNQTA